MKAPAFWWAEAPGTAAALLAPVERLVARTAVRRLAQAPAERLKVPVICVGNPTVGGSGKTPAAIAVAALLTARGKEPFFLTRGWRGRLAGPVRVDPARHTSRDVGDEALLLARHAPVVVAADRAAGGRFAYANGADAVVMDDGFQNPGLAKDLSWLVIDAEVGVGNGRVTPAGPLRAPLEEQLPRADAVILVGHGAAGEKVAGAARAAGVAVYQAFLVGRAPQIVGRRVLAYVGIGRPEKFFATCREIGAEVVETRAFADHHPFSEADARALLAAAERAQAMLVTTEKDAARLAGAEGDLAELLARSFAVPAKLVFERPQEIEAAIDAVLGR